MSSLGVALSIGAPSLLHNQLAQLQRKSPVRRPADEAATTAQPPATPIVANAASVNQPPSIAQGSAAPPLANSLLALLINVQGDGSAAPSNSSSQTPPSALAPPANANAASAAPASTGTAPTVSAAPGGDSVSPRSANPVASDRADSVAAPSANAPPADSNQPCNVGAAQLGQPTAAAAYTAALTNETANSTLSVAA